MELKSTILKRIIKENEINKRKNSSSSNKNYK